MRDWKRCLVKPDRPIREAVQVLDQSGLQIVLIVDDRGVLVGTVTDGDIRRALLRGVDFDSAVDGIAHKTPTTVRQNTPQDEVVALMQSGAIRRVPVLDHDGVVVALEFMEDALRPAHPQNIVVLMAGGLGSRLRPLTEATPKPMLEVGDRPILQTIIESFARHGFRRFYVSVNYEREQIMSYFGDGTSFGVSIDYLEEDEKLGTAGALSLLPVVPTAPLFVMNGDLLTRVNFVQMLDFHQTQRAAATMAVREFSMQVPYGVIEHDESDTALVRAIVEKPVHQVFVNAGIYLLEPKALELVEKGKALDMPVLFERLIARGEQVRSFPLREYWLDIGRIDDFHRARAEYDEVFP